MTNKMHNITEKELASVREQLRGQSGIWVAEIDGSSYPTLASYLSGISAILRFPIPSKGLDGYLDWITDLGWLNADGYALIITNSKKLIEEEPEKREDVLWLFKEDVLPWWQEEVEKDVVGGKAKPFNVYLVD